MFGSGRVVRYLLCGAICGSNINLYKQAMENLRYIGTITRPHGLRGDCVLSDVAVVPDFTTALNVYVGYSASFAKPYTLVSLKATKNGCIVHFQDVESVDAVHPLKELGVFVEENILRDSGVVFTDDYVGCEVYDLESGNLYGSVVDVWDLPAYEALVVLTDSEEEVAVPVVDEIVVSVDLDGKKIVINPPIGLF